MTKDYFDRAKDYVPPQRRAEPPTGMSRIEALAKAVQRISVYARWIAIFAAIGFIVWATL
jgi:hypothetical protein